MFATVLIHAPLVLLPLLQLPQPATECRLDVLSPQAIEERALAGFTSEIEAYVTLHRRLARSLPPKSMFGDEDDYLGDDLRTILIDARPLARQGAFFTPQAAAVFEARLDRALQLGVSTAHWPLHAPLPGEPEPTVNRQFPLVSGRVHWPALASALPPLPAELQYVFWGRDLVLVDVAADLVIDVLPGALPEGAAPGVIYP